MPSDPRVEQLLHALSSSLQPYQSAVTAAVETIRGLRAAAGGGDDRTTRLQAELGSFATARIDATRLAGLLGETSPLDPKALTALERAAETLHTIAAARTDLFHVRVASNEDLIAAVESRLASIGRAFGAARLTSAVAGGVLLSGLSEDLLDAFEFSHWSGSERRLAPPLVVSVDGNDLRAAGLAEFMDGGQKIVLLVDGDCAPAPLARLITPGVLVIQAADLGAIDQLAGWPGPAVCAIAPSAAHWTHDPSAGPELWQRITIATVPPPPRRRVAGCSVAQQLDELRQVQALAAVPAPAPRSTETGTAATPADPVDRLAAWLLQHTDLSQAAPEA